MSMTATKILLHLPVNCKLLSHCTASCDHMAVVTLCSLVPGKLSRLFQQTRQEFTLHQQFDQGLHLVAPAENRDFQEIINFRVCV